jgi:hypothetical protein
LYPQDESDQQTLDQLMAIISSPEERSKKAAVLDIEVEDIRYLDVNFHVKHYADWEKKLPQATIEATRPMAELIERQPVEIQPADRAAFLEAVQADYLEMSDYQMFESEYLTCANVDMQVEYPHLPSYNRFRDRHYPFYISVYNQNVFDLLQERDYLDAEAVEYIREGAK